LILRFGLLPIERINRTHKFSFAILCTSALQQQLLKTRSVDEEILLKTLEQLGFNTFRLRGVVSGLMIRKVH